ncbi:MAG: sodium:calcium exchanger [Cyanobacteria bacterium QH_9_48_43]|nr:MAG: sodium:calcium exchanger [Cyanobacteria bacterium QH_1_48_107]PSO57006.1 MAG: sodium:calcium exchanger [Cyanobacteria bacterium QH_7_48_89]PSO58286.1 MAG: sodium:calcium exchanger [Cyanobacteria bacterium QH_10_48_56]PSO81058.1 MAG: sodium:calcium exchanger [Cyanobacteria bacterium QH_9_48_43]PSO91585.1 MAG: sodium:calcium exchanger [Cyanobacteria bacterium QS_6_48_18]PSO94556.1 MAG: sodium:calcium exchanger [Cyanobacteria bacterium SW_6_48_11]PSP05862.1 MAG: sodium:calcium exchanger 
MEEDFRLIIDLVSVLVAAATGGLLAVLCRQPALLGYLLGGMIIGPAGLGLVKELVQIETLAQFGVAFLLFALGVEFSLAELKKVQAIALGGGGLQIALTILVTAVVSIGVGWVNSPAQGVFLGGILSLSSTAVVLKSLMERNEIDASYGQVMLGILVVQDLALGLMLAVLPALNQSSSSIGFALGFALLKIGLFAAAAVAAGIWLIPSLLRVLAKTESQELFLLGVVVLCLVIAVLTDQLGLSIEMGAFVAGLMISEAEYADQTLSYVEPLRDVFAALFFAAIGMLIDPVFLWQNLELILGLVCLVIIGKSLIFTPLVRLFGYSWRTAITIGLGLAQIGEFSFVLASEGQALGLVSRQVYLLILGTTALTLVVTPFVMQLVPRLLIWAEKWSLLKRLLDPAEVSPELVTEPSLRDHIVICGYRGVGGELVRFMQENNAPVVVIDHSEANIQQLREAGIAYVYGNSASLHVLEKAGVEQAQSMVVALPDSMSTRLCLKRSLELNPVLDVVVLAHKNREIELLYQLGAREVVQPEFEASLELAAHLLAGRGLPVGMIQQDKEKIRNSHYLDLRPEQQQLQVSRELQIAANEMNSQWYTLPEETPLTEMTLEEANIRRLTGASVVAIRRRGGEEINYPNGQVKCCSGDRLLIVGEPEELAAFKQLAQGEMSIPEASTPCQWLLVPESSPAAEQTLAQLHWRRNYGVQIQAIRRDGRYISFPDGQAQIKAGDRLLLCGGSQQLHQLRQWIAPESEIAVSQGEG